MVLTRASKATYETAQSVAALPLSRLAWRNLWRHKTRTLLLILVVAYSTFMIAFLWSFNNGANDGAVRANASYISAPVQVSSQAWADDPDPTHALPSLEFLTQLTQLPQVKAATLRLDFPALVRSAYASEGILVRGVDLATEGSVSKLPQGISEGRWLQGVGEVVLGYKLAERLDVRLGERLVLDTSALAGPQAAGLKVVGLLKVYVPPVDEGAVLMDLNQARSLTGVKTATSVALSVPWGQEARVARIAQAQLPQDLQASGIWDLIGAIKADIELENQFMPMFGLLFGLVAAFAVTSAVLVSVIERTREFGIIGALGLSPRALAIMVTLEAIFTTVLGWLVGLLLAYALIGYLATHNVLGPMFRDILGAFPSVGVTSEIYADPRPIYALYATLPIALAAVLAILIPARRVLRLKPAEAMRME